MTLSDVRHCAKNACLICHSDYLHLQYDAIHKILRLCICMYMTCSCIIHKINKYTAFLQQKIRSTKFFKPWQSSVDALHRPNSSQRSVTLRLSGVNVKPSSQRTSTCVSYATSVLLIVPFRGASRKLHTSAATDGASNCNQ